MKVAEEKVTIESLISREIKIMNFGGINPLNQTIFTRLNCKFLMLSAIIFFILQLTNMATTKHKAIANIALDTAILFGMDVIFIKFYTCHTKYKKLAEMIYTIKEKFWKYDNEDEKIRKKLEDMVNSTSVQITILRNSLLVATAGVFSVSYFLGTYYLIVNIWLPNSIRFLKESSPSYQIIYAIQVYLVGNFVITSYLAMDILFITLSVSAVMQLKLIKHKIMSLGRGHVEEDKKVIKTCIIHHDLILQFLSDVDYIFNQIAFHMLGSNTLLTVVLFYACRVDTMSWFMFATIAITDIGLFIEFFLYCFIGQLIQDETESIGIIAYNNSKWYNISDHSTKKELLLMILRSQNYSSITVGGFLDLNLESYGRVVKLMWSILACLMNSDLK